MVNSAYALNAYTQAKVETISNPVELVIMLYDGAIESLDKSATAITMKKIRTKLKYISKAMAIIDELLNSLNLEAGGEIALNLQNLYLHMMNELLHANIKNDEDKVRQVAKLLREMREAWVQIKGTV